MNDAEIKLELFRKIDMLEESELEEVYGILLNFLNSKNDYNEWDQLTNEQKDAILYGVKELDEGMGILHENLMEKYKKKYPDA